MWGRCDRPNAVLARGSRLRGRAAAALPLGRHQESTASTPSPHLENPVAAGCRDEEPRGMCLVP